MMVIVYYETSLENNYFDFRQNGSWQTRCQTDVRMSTHATASTSLSNVANFKQ